MTATVKACKGLTCLTQLRDAIKRAEPLNLSAPERLILKKGKGGAPLAFPPEVLAEDAEERKATLQ